jgi:anti-sigma factor RsiW
MNDSSDSMTAMNILQLLDSEADGSLSAAERARVESMLERRPELARERRLLTRLHDALRETRVEVEPRFTERVMDEVRRARPHIQHPGLWSLAASILLLVAALGVAGATGSGAIGGWLAPIGAVTDFLATTVIAGAGLLGASWEGIGTTVAGWLRSSTANLVLLGGLVVALHLLLYSLLRRRRPARERQRS